MAHLLDAVAAALRPAVADAVRDAVARPSVPIAAAGPARAVEAAADDIATDAAARASELLGPLVAHATNGESWWQSRVTIGSLVALAAPFAGAVFGHTVSPDEQALATTLLTAAGVAVGAALTLYGRWVATRPLGA